MNFIGNLLKGIIAIVMVAGVFAAGVGIYLFVAQNFNFVPDQEKAPAQPVMFTITAGENVDQITQNLEREKIIDNKAVFLLKLKIRKADSSLQAGKFQVTPGMDMDKLITALTTPSADSAVRFTIIEGKRLEEIAEDLGSKGIVDAAKFMEMAGTPAGSAAFADDFVLNSGHRGERGLEGYLFPDTYEIKSGDGDNSEEVIRVMLEEMEKKVTPEMRATIAGQGKNLHDVLTVASIVQREGVVQDELPTIAAVFWNRLERDMRLEADPTTQYAVAPKEGAWWPNLNLFNIIPNEVDHPYNTYWVYELPPSPICNPGLASIRAAIYPADNKNVLYFVAKKEGDGSHVFAETFEDHLRNIENNQ